MSRADLAPVAVRILSNPTYLAVVRSAAERFCALAGFPDETAGQIGLALDEALANVIKHGYEGRDDQPIHVEFQVLTPETTPQLRICVRDYGRQVDESQISPRELDDVRPGGLGVHIMRSVMDRVQFRRRGLTGMELEMTKCIVDGSPAAGGDGQGERESDA